MIPNMPEATPTMLDTLKNSKFEFYLTGSQFFGGAESDSDWDFFAQDSPDVWDYLHALKFVWVPNEGYKDATSVFYYRDRVTDTAYHIQLVPDVAHKLRAQMMLKPFLKYIPKNLHRILWNEALEITKL